MECDLCKNATSSDNDHEICKTCGYKPDLKSIKDRNNCKQHYQKLKNERGNWVKQVEFLGRLAALTRYTNSEIARLLGFARSTICQDLQLFKNLEERPELTSINSKSMAFKKLNELSPARIFSDEEKLHRNLYHNWNKTPFAKEWQLVKTGSYCGKFNTYEIGEMDMLAQNKSRDQWLVIELKKGPGSDDTLGQIFRYMGWLKTNKAAKEDIVKGLIICGEYNLQMDYALKCAPNIMAKIYRSAETGLEFRDFDKNSYVLDLLEQLPPEVRKKVIGNYRKDD